MIAEVQFLASQNLMLSRLGGVVGLLLAFCTQSCGFDPGPSQWIFMMQKIDSAMSYDYTTLKRFLEFLFNLNALSKIKFPSTNFASAEFRCLPLGKKLGVKITSSNWYRLKGDTLKRDTSSREMYSACKGRNKNAQPNYRKKERKQLVYSEELVQS
ncbi:hypothetical protein TNCV_181491 [Trichonephila clavipes]|nr:hypothetical protein TNCV_181491 [Trichonephila clavipes]